MFSCIINYNFSLHVMYIIPHLYVVKDFWSFKILDQFWEFLSFRFPHILGYECFFEYG